MDRVRALVLDAILRVQRGEAFASECLSHNFSERPDLGGRARTIAARRLFGLIHWRRTLQFALEHAGVPAGRSESAALHYVAHQVLFEKLEPRDAIALAPEVKWLAVTRALESLSHEADPVRRLALGCSLPDFLARRIHDEFAEEAVALAKALSQPPPLTVRVNTLKTTVREVIALLAKSHVTARPGRFAATALTVDADGPYSDEAAPLGKLRSDGLVEPQDEGSQAVADLVAPPKSGGIVVDLCAGAGGKTLAVGAQMENRGQLWALSLSRANSEELRRRAKRAGLTNVRALTAHEKQWPAELAALRGKANRVLVDAPCSGVGSLRRKPEARWKLTEEALTRLPNEQLAILRDASTLCAPGGRLIYATCTLLRAENEDVIARFLEETPVFEVARVGGKHTKSPFLKLLPHRDGADGFFAAVLFNNAGRRASADFADESDPVR